MGTFDTNIKIAYPNVPFTPPAATYLEVRFLPNSTRNLYVSNDDPSQFVGIFQITIVSPSGAGEIAPRNIASHIVEHFKKGTRLQKSDVIVKVYSKPSVAPAMQDGDRFRIPVSVQYQCIHK